MNKLIEKNPRTSAVVTLATVLSLMTGTGFNLVDNSNLTEKVYETKADIRVLTELLFSTGALKTRPLINISEDLYDISENTFNWATLKLESGECECAGRKEWYQEYFTKEDTIILWHAFLEKLAENKELYPIVTSDFRGFWYIKIDEDTDRKLYLGPLEDRKADDWIVFECKEIENDKEA